jgi:hypothetical protein
MTARTEAEDSALKNVGVRSPILVNENTQKEQLGLVTNATKNLSLVACYISISERNTGQNDAGTKV